jgi:hypothetical protein
MKTLQRLAFLQLVLALFLSAASLSAFADPPSRAVRLRYMSGAVSVQPGGVNDWVEAVVNRPLTSADRVWTDQNARAELNLGSASMRMNAETSLTLTNVSDEIVQVELDQGTLNLHIRHLFGGETYEIDTPNQAFTILKAGDYRFDVDPNADTTSVTVWKGEGEANGQGNGVRVRSGEQASFTGGTSLEHRTSGAPGLDGFDDWCRVRDNREDHAESYRYVSADVVGADDLDDYGNWRTTGEYGAVWVPRVAPGWTPYRYGHWVWVEPWGWSWVDDAPWGYAPCHYGRWVYTGGYWGWAPGPMVVERPIYAPALVAWVGGEHFGVSMSFGGGGGVGWFPLGWGEPYVPSYRVSRTYFQNVNVRNTRIVNITNVTNNYYVENNTTVVNRNVTNIRYANQNVRGAVTAVPTRVMVNSQAVGRSAVAVSENEVRAGRVAMAAPVAPERTSVLGGGAGGRAAPPARVGNARPVFARTAPPPKPVPFEAKQEQLARNPGRPLDNQTEAELRTKVERENPPAPARNNAPTPAGRPGAAPAPNVNAPRPNPTPQPGAPERPGNQPGRPEAPAGRPGAAPAPNVNAPQPTPAPRPSGPERPAQPGNPNAPARNVPRPPQPNAPANNAPASNAPANNAPANAAPPANAPRNVPRPPDRGDNPRQPDRTPNLNREQPSPTAPNERNNRGAQPARPQPAQPDQPQPPRAEQPNNRPDRAPAPPATAPQPRRDNAPPDNARPNNPPQPPREAPAPRPEQPRREAPAPRPEQPRQAPPQPQAQPRQEPQRPPAESRPQRQEQPQRDTRPQQRSEPKNEKPKNEDKQKPDRSNYR